MTLGEAVIFHQKTSQRGLTAETYQLTAISASGGISFPFPKGDLVAHCRVPGHYLPEGLPACCAFKAEDLQTPWAPGLSSSR